MASLTQWIRSHLQFQRTAERLLDHLIGSALPGEVDAQLAN